MLKRKFTIAGAVLAACVVLGGGASAASAAPATFNLTGVGGTVAQGPFTITNALPNQTLSCPASGSQTNLANTGSPAQGSLLPIFAVQFCSGWGVELFPQPLLGSSSAGVYSLSSGRWIVRLGGSTVSSAAPVTVQVPWINGTGSTASTYTFNNTTIAISSLNGLPIKLTGTFNATKAGSLLTLT